MRSNRSSVRNFSDSPAYSPGLEHMVKIDIISGFLGAGKTTFANLLLRYYMDSGLRPVYIVNEAGQTVLDADVIKADGFEAVEIKGGCVCCTVKNDVSAAITKVIDTFAPTNIVFEPSGIFVFDNFFDILKQPAINKRSELANVITIVDSVNFSFSKAVYGSFIYNQIKNAPVLLLSKLEKTKYDVDEILCDIKNINPDAFVISKIWSDWVTADFELLLNRQKTAGLRFKAHHHNNLRLVTVKLDTAFSQNAFDSFILACKSGVFGDIYRVKGIVMVEEQAVLLNIALQDTGVKKFNGMSEPALTFIGQTINEKEILAFLKAC